MDFQECTINLRHIKSILNTLEEIRQKALEFEEAQKIRNQTLDRKFFRKAWELQYKNARKFFIIEQAFSSKYYAQKISNLFKRKNDRTLTELEKFDAFFNSLMTKDIVFKDKNKIKFRSVEFVTPCIIYPNFDKKIENVVLFISPFDYFSIFLSRKSIPALENLSLEYQEEVKNFIVEDQSEIFNEYLKEKSKEFGEKTDSYRQNTIFDHYSYDPCFLFEYFSLMSSEYIKEEINRQNIIYKLLLDNYRNAFNKNNRLNYYNLFDFHRKQGNPEDLLENVDNFFVFEECNILTELNCVYSFPVYPEVHDTIVKVIIEMKKRNLIPKHIEDCFLQTRDPTSEFLCFYKKVVERYELQDKLENSLTRKEAQRKRVNKI
jgi:hypothetical protein